jgi:hypothetical protein
MYAELRRLQESERKIRSMKQEAENGLLIGDEEGMRDALQTILNYADEHLGITVPDDHPLMHSKPPIPPTNDSLETSE